MIIAVDPGKSGGIACSIHHEEDMNPASYVFSMPDTEQGLVNLLGGLITPGTTVYVETVGGYMGGGGQPGSAMFNFGWWASGPVWIAQCYQARVIKIPPQKWQKTLGLGTAKGKSSHDRKNWKNKLKAEAQRRHPTLAITLKTADAVLILEAALILEK